MGSLLALYATTAMQLRTTQCSNYHIQKYHMTDRHTLIMDCIQNSNLLFSIPSGLDVQRTKLVLKHSLQGNLLPRGSRVLAFIDGFVFHVWRFLLTTPQVHCSHQVPPHRPSFGCPCPIFKITHDRCKITELCATLSCL